MTRHFILCLSVFAFTVIAIGPAWAVTYTITDLGTLGGTGTTRAYDINNAGQVTGYSSNSSELPGSFIWENGIITDLGTLSGSGLAYFGRGITNDGTVLVREYISSSESYAGLWTSGSLTYYMGPSCGRETNVWGINDNKAVVGEEYGKYFAGYAASQAVLYMNGSFVDMGMTSPTLNYWSSVARAVSNDFVVGYGYTDPTQLDWSPFRYDIAAGTVADLCTIVGNDAVKAYGINEAGWIVGETYDPAFGYDGYLYNGTTTLDIPRLPCSGSSQPNNVNNNGQVVGYGRSLGAVSTRAFLYESDTSTITLLYDLLLPSAQAEWSSLANAYAINDAGQIVGYGTTADGYERAFIMTPVPEPSTCVLAGIAIVGLLGWAWRRRARVM